jgi:hypothetical protein
MKITRFNWKYGQERVTATSGTSGGSGGVGGITVTPSPLTDGYVITYDAGTGTFILAPGAGGGATSPLVGATDGGTGNLGGSVSFDAASGASGGNAEVVGGTGGGAGDPGGFGVIAGGDEGGGTFFGSSIIAEGGGAAVHGFLEITTNGTNGGTGLMLASNGAGQTAWTRYVRALFNYFTDVSNGTTVETDLYTDTIPAATLTTNGDKLTVTYGGTFQGAATATQRTRVYFAGTAILDTTAVNNLTTSNWSVSATIIRVSNTVVRYAVSLSSPELTTALYQAVGELTALNLTTTGYVAKITGQAGGAGGGSTQITAKLGTIVLVPAA